MSDEDKGQVDTGKPQQQPKPAAAETPEGAPVEEQPINIEVLQQEIEKQKEVAKRHLNQWKRTAADLENYRKRVEREQGELVKFGHATLITRLLPILDDLERAFQTLPDGLGSLTWVEGLVLIDRKLRLVLESQGLKEIEAAGKPFDPAVHEAVLEEAGNAYSDGQVIMALQKGYRLHDRVLRPAMVKVARNPQSSGAAAEETSQTDKQGESEGR
jgi:molecular chaperone GrpE